MARNYKLSVDANLLNLSSPIFRAEIRNRRSNLIDSFIQIPEIKLTINEIVDSLFEIMLIDNAYGSFYEIVLFSEREMELLRCFFIMPSNDCYLHELRLLTAYPEVTSTATSFLKLSDTPNSYAGKAGKTVAVREDESGLEFIDSCEIDPKPPEPQPEISCANATSLMSFSQIAGDWEIYIDDMDTPAVSGRIGQIVGQLSTIFANKIFADYDNFMLMQNLDTVPHRVKFTPIANTEYQANLPENPSFVADDNGSFYFCLNPSQTIISCDGATDKVALADNPDYAIWELVQSIIINDVECEKPIGFPDNFPITFPDGEMRVSVRGQQLDKYDLYENMGLNPLRVILKLKGNGMDNFVTPSDRHNDNPTIVFDEQRNEVRFCLAGKAI